MILVLNCGSQSIKWKLFDDKLETVKSNKVEVLNAQEYQVIIEKELKGLAAEKIDIIGHRVVHGGVSFFNPTKVTQQNLVELEKVSYFAPLHNPYNILGIKACQKIFSGKNNIAFFDTEFFSQLPERAHTYALPEDISKKFGFKRYGFHGISHEYVAKEAAKRIKKPFNKLKIITCHLGGGASMAAIENGRAIDTSMGFTPMEGLVMMTRPGNIDAGIVLQLVKEFSLEKAGEILNKQSGVKGICQESEMLGVLDKLNNGDKRAQLAFDVFVYSIQKYIGAYVAILGGCDALVFTGSVGSGIEKTRNEIIKNLGIIKKYKTKIFAIETNEELAIAQKLLNYE